MNPENSLCLILLACSSFRSNCLGRGRPYKADRVNRRLGNFERNSSEVSESRFVLKHPKQYQPMMKCTGGEEYLEAHMKINIEIIFFLQL